MFRRSRTHMYPQQQMMMQQPYPMMQQQQMPLMFDDFDPNRRVPLFHPKGYVPKDGAARPNLRGVPQPKDMFKSAVRYISPAVYHPDEPGKNVSQNVVSVELGSLYHGVDLMTGDPIRCKQCRALLCQSDAPCLKRKEEEKKEGDEEEEEEDTTRVWTCRYCGCVQDIEVDDAEIPKSNVSEYVVVPGSEPDSKAAAGDAAATAAATTADDDDCYVVFCVDVSGSMTMTSSVNGKYISKLACVAGAVYSQMDALRHEHPNRRVCLITFGNNIDVFNGTEHKQASGMTLSEWDSIVKFAENITVNDSITKVFDAMADEVIYMKERGATALGPALLSAITIASRKRGSYVVLCTDGMANQGIGSLEGLRIRDEDTEKSEVELLYEKFGDTAKDSGVTVSVIGIKGAECRMENLGVVADKSGGSVDLADSESVDFSGTLEEPVIATGVQVVVRVEPAFVFENGTNSISAEVGNVKRISQQQCALFSSPDEKVKPPSEVRLQTEILFTKPSGSVNLRVVEIIIPFIEDVRKAVDGIDVRLVGGYVSRTAAKMAHEGEVEAAGTFSQGYQDKLNEFYGVQSHVDTEQTEMMNMFTAQNTRAQCMVQSSVMTQRSAGMSNFSAARRRDDATSAALYQMRSDAGSQQCLIM